MRDSEISTFRLFWPALKIGWRRLPTTDHARAGAPSHWSIDSLSYPKELVRAIRG